LQDGTYSIIDLLDFHEALDARDEISAQVAAWHKIHGDK
jgi:hypothetical protein